jgi:hypothetical protein
MALVTRPRRRALKSGLKSTSCKISSVCSPDQIGCSNPASPRSRPGLDGYDRRSRGNTKHIVMVRSRAHASLQQGPRHAPRYPRSSLEPWKSRAVRTHEVRPAGKGSETYASRVNIATATGDLRRMSFKLIHTLASCLLG